MTKRAVFLDRDGTIMADVGYPSDPRQVCLLPHAVEGLKLLRDHGYALVVVSNQSGIARGKLTLDDANRVNAELQRQLQITGVSIDAFYFCPHHDDDDCECRKPKAGMLNQAIAEHRYNRKGSVIIGDRPRDVEAGRNAGVRTVRIVDGPHANEHSTTKADHDAKDLLTAARWILASDATADENETGKDASQDEKEHRAVS